MAKHTTGPWRADNRDILFASDERRTIATAYFAGVGDGGNDEVLANAKLIAAAPDLLAALERIARMAIAKATT